MPEAEVIDLTDLPDEDPPAPAGLDPQQRAMAQHLLNVYPRQNLRDALARLLERQDIAIELAVYQALLASGGPAAVQGPAPVDYVAAPGVVHPPYNAHAPFYPALPAPHGGNYSEEEDEDEEDERPLEVCWRCNEEFDPEDDEDESCSYHPGVLNTYSSSPHGRYGCLAGSLVINRKSHGWADWDEDVHGPMDSYENRRDYPENFMWSCCEKAGDDKSGCEDVPHSVG